MNYRKEKCASPVRSTVFQGLLRLFLFATTTASVLCLVNCGSTKQAVSVTDTKKNLQQEVGVKVAVESGQEESEQDTALLTLPSAAVTMLPEGAEYSTQKGQTRVSAFRGKGDSIHIRATGLKSQKQKLRVTAEASGGVTSADSTRTESAAGGHWDQPFARGQPVSNNGGSHTVNLLLLLIIAAVAYGIIRQLKSD